MARWASCSSHWRTVDVIEYYNASQDRCFISSLQADIDALDTGQFKGWVRTGRTFEAYSQPTPPDSRIRAARNTAIKFGMLAFGADA